MTTLAPTLDYLVTLAMAGHAAPLPKGLGVVTVETIGPDIDGTWYAVVVNGYEEDRYCNTDETEGLVRAFLEGEAIPLAPVQGAVVRTGDDGHPRVDIVTCGTCGRSWNNAAISAITPAPSGRCIFEAVHE